MTTQVVGTIVGWRHAATGAWFSKNGDRNIQNADGTLQLLRLLLKKIDGEITDAIIDDLTSIAKLEAKRIE